ncbi:ABC transporter permease [uncultured Maribacter sp.]|uniref:ABC transporter permease n=1 Tax=uncultured Maribacter sp. TaxID=431308 RepID=UPI00261B39DD|nr:ABC transporter permease [uncultured Maribacter sp.]
MVKNYLKIAWRNLIRNKSFSFINIVGLSLGLASSIFIFIWVKDERAIDTFHENGEQLYVVTSREYTGNEIFDSYDTPGLLAEELKDKIPEIEYGCNIGWNSYHTFSSNEKTLKLKGNYAGADFFSMFSYPLLIGSKETILESPESIAISKNKAVSLFGSIENFEYKVTVNWPIVFAIAGACVFITALLTMSFQAIKTALANPVKSLRTE